MYSGRRVLEVPLYSVFEASRYLQVPENTLRSWVAGRAYPLRSGGSRRSEPVIELADPKSSRLSFNNLTEAHGGARSRRPAAAIQRRVAPDSQRGCIPS